MTHPDMINDVRTFMLVFGQARQVASHCHLPPQSIRRLRERLITSEHEEFLAGWAKDDIVEIADALADLVYVILGTALAYGIPFEAVWDEVQMTNMRKAWTREEVAALTGPDVDLLALTDLRSPTAVIPKTGWTVLPINADTVPWATSPMYAVLSETGKVQKPPSWKEPNIKDIIEKSSQPARLPSAEEMYPGDPKTLTPEALAEQEVNRKKWNEALAKEGINNQKAERLSSLTSLEGLPSSNTRDEVSPEHREHGNKQSRGTSEFGRANQAYEKGDTNDLS